MSKRNYTTHRAIMSVQFDCSAGCDPSEVADEIVRDMIGDGYPANLEEVVDVIVKDKSPTCLKTSFIKPSLEAGHGDDFMASFVFVQDNDNPEIFVCASVDLLMQHNDDFWIPIGAVCGGVEIVAVRNSDGSLNTEQMCRDWIGVWHRHFVGSVEDSVLGIYLMIKQVVSEGRPTK